MKIKKIGYTVPKGQIVNQYNEDDNNTYGCDYINNLSNLLWTNPNPNQPLSSGNMDFSDSNYDIVEIFFLTHVKSERTIESVRFLKGYNATLQTINRSGGQYTRELTRVSDTQYSYSDGYTFTSFGGGKTATSNVCLPLYAIGYKTGLFS